MLTVNLIAIGKLKEKFMRDGLDEYSKRLSSFCKFNIIELGEYKVSENPTQKEIEKALEEEGKEILSKVSKGYIFAMCIEGKQLSSENLAENFAKIAQTESTINFIIGGSFGLSNAVKSKANFKLSISPMTFPHQLFRVMLAEQIYRGFAINSGSKYHK